jgi:hypothetical protein
MKKILRLYQKGFLVAQLTGKVKNYIPGDIPGFGKGIISVTHEGKTYDIEAYIDPRNAFAEIPDAIAKEWNIY